MPLGRGAPLLRCFVETKRDAVFWLRVIVEMNLWGALVVPSRPQTSLTYRHLFDITRTISQDTSLVG